MGSGELLGKPNKSGADLGGGCRGCTPLAEMTYSFLIQLVFCKKKHGLLVLVTPFLSGAPPPKKNPGSAPVNCGGAAYNRPASHPWGSRSTPSHFILQKLG